MSRATSSSARRVVGLGFLPEEARHGFLIDVPRGSATSDMICITEHRGSDLDHLGARSVNAPPLGDPSLRVVIDRNRCWPLPRLLGRGEPPLAREWPPEC